MEGLAAFALIFVVLILVFGAIVSYLTGEGEGFWTYTFLFLISQINGVGGLLWLVLVLAALLLGSEKMKAGAWSSVGFVVVTTVGLLLVLSPFYHFTISLF